MWGLGGRFQWPGLREMLSWIGGSFEPSPGRESSLWLSTAVIRPGATLLALLLRNASLSPPPSVAS